jgi:hypothetical protein
MEIGKEIIATILLFAFLVISCSNYDNFKEKITIARGLNENPEIPKLAVEVNKSGELFIYTSIPKKDTSHYYKGEISDKKYIEIKKEIDTHFGHFSSKINQHVYDATKLELVLKQDDKVWNIAGNQFEFTDNQFKIIETLFELEKDIKLTPISFHKFDTYIQLEEIITVPIKSQAK